MISLEKALSFRSAVTQQRSDVLHVLQVLGRPISEFLPDWSLSFGDVVLLRTYTAIQRRCIIQACYLQTILSLWGVDLRNAIDATDVENTGKMPTLAIIISDRRFATVVGLSPGPPEPHYDLLECQWRRGPLPRTTEGISYDLAAIAHACWSAHNATGDKTALADVPQ